MIAGRDAVGWAASSKRSKGALRSVTYSTQAYRVIHCNPAWDNFAVRNGAPGLTGENVIGPNIFEAIPTVLKNFFFRCICAGVNAGHMGSVL